MSLLQLNDSEISLVSGAVGTQDQWDQNVKPYFDAWGTWLTEAAFFQQQGQIAQDSTYNDAQQMALDAAKDAEAQYYAAGDRWVHDQPETGLSAKEGVDAINKNADRKIADALTEPEQPTDANPATDQPKVQYSLSPEERAEFDAEAKENLQRQEEQAQQEMKEDTKDLDDQIANTPIDTPEVPPPDLPPIGEPTADNSPAPDDGWNC
jgi:hypothetical protein